MKVLVVSGTGTVGSRVVRELQNRKAVEATITSRRADRPGFIYMDWQDAQSIESALKGKDKVVLITPASPTEAEDGVRFARLAESAGVKHVVFLSIHHARRALRIPHFASKFDIEVALAASKMKWTVIAANNFFQNDYWYKQAILEYGVYPQPFGNIGLSRIDVDDIATAIANAIADDGMHAQTFPLTGLQALTGEETAEIYSAALNREIRYVGNDLETWEREALRSLPPWLVADWKQMYAFFQTDGLKATAEDLLQQSKILKRPPKLFEKFVKETVQSWKGN